MCSVCLRVCPAMCVSLCVCSTLCVRVHVQRVHVCVRACMRTGLHARVPCSARDLAGVPAGAAPRTGRAPEGAPR